jgi:hypothetical protein
MTGAEIAATLGGLPGRFLLQKIAVWPVLRPSRMKERKETYAQGQQI